MSSLQIAALHPVVCMGMEYVLAVLVTTSRDTLHPGIQMGVTEVKAMLPGVNIPASDFWIYFLAIGLGTVFHELGHAFAAAQEDVPIVSVGVYVFTIIPIAFVKLNTEQLNSLPIIKRLKIFCAVLFSIAYKTDIGVRVTDITADSPLKDARGLDRGDVITAINACNIKDSYDWSYCLHVAHDRFGICTSAEFIAQNDEIIVETVKEYGVIECCRKDDHYSFCFEYMEPKVAVDSVLPGQYSCLRPRDMVKEKLVKCTEVGGYTCPQNMHCLKPSLNNHTYFIIIEREDNNAVIFLGWPYDIYRSVFVDQYFPRLSVFSIFSPTQCEKLLKFVFLFSMGIGFINIIPCYGTDGHHIARNLIQMLARFLNKSER
ncbi:unnamed protein product [Leptidea sinapis]|uniref:Endopeptidase S2P n=1 Tax=Leptidea sinapis TaxID=189913 RepID=A0A5E4QQN7_9NEOP|nr:unnamed protein product [Leptidea sinapis]